MKQAPPVLLVATGLALVTWVLIAERNGEVLEFMLRRVHAHPFAISGLGLVAAIVGVIWSLVVFLPRR